MNRSVSRKAALAVLLASAGLGLASQAFADAVTIAGPAFQFVNVSADAAGGICDEDAPCAPDNLATTACCRFGTGPVLPLTRTIIDIGGGNFAYASARVNVALEARSVEWVRGDAAAGLGVSAIGDTAAYDSLDVSMAPIVGPPNQARVVLNGLLRVQSPPGRRMITTRRVIVYPNSALAQADQGGAGTGAIFLGNIVVTSIPGNVPVVAYSGGFSSGDFVTDVSAGNTLNIRVNNVTKTVTADDSTAIAVRASSDSRPVLVNTAPGQSPVSIAVLGFALAGIGLVVLRRKRASIAA